MSHATQRMKILLSLNGVAQLIGRIPVPQGPNATYLTAVTLILVNWFSANGDIFGPAAAPWMAIGLTALQGAHAISALYAQRSVAGGTVHVGKAVFIQFLATAGQAATQLTPLVGPEYQEYVGGAIPVLQALNSMAWLHKEPAS